MFFNNKTKKPATVDEALTAITNTIQDLDDLAVDHTSYAEDIGGQILVLKDKQEYHNFESGRAKTIADRFRNFVKV